MGKTRGVIDRKNIAVLFPEELINSVGGLYHAAVAVFDYLRLAPRS
jgi:ATP-dependent protease ClpP protease subunit